MIRTNTEVQASTQNEKMDHVERLGASNDQTIGKCSIIENCLKGNCPF